MNRGDYILQELRSHVSGVTSFTSATILNENTNNNTGDKTTVYLYIIKETLIEASENYSMRIYSVDVGVRLKKTIKLKTSGSAWRNDAIDKLENCIYNFATRNTTDTGRTFHLGAAHLQEIAGYFDDARTNADADAIIRIKVTQEN